MPTNPGAEITEDEHEDTPLVQAEAEAPQPGPSSSASGERRVEEMEEEGDDEEETLEDYAGMVVTILQPVAITMILVVWVVRILNASNISLSERFSSFCLHTTPSVLNINISSSGAIYQVYTEDDNDGTATKLFGSLLNALIFLAIIIGVTVLFVILYKYRCLKVQEDFMQNLFYFC